MVLNESQVRTRIVHLLDQEANEPETWWWISYADPALPKGSQFLGGVFVRAKGQVNAHLEATSKGLNPGGQALFLQVDLDVDVRSEWAYRLLSRAECDTMGTQWKA